MRKTAVFRVSFVAASLFCSTVALAQDQAAPPGQPGATPPAQDEGGGVGLNVDLEVASAYVWRGANVWNAVDQQTQYLTLFPSLGVSVASFSAGYWSAYQLTGSNKGDNVDANLGAEQDLYASYDLGLSEELTLSFLATYYFYPFGTDYGHAIEPGAGIGYSGPVDAGLNLLFFKGIDDATDAISHIYINPSVGKSIGLTDSLELGVGVGFGYKVWTHEDMDTALGNNWDVQGDVGVTYAMDSFYVSPAVHVAYTDKSEEDPGTGETAHGLTYWGGANVGYDLSF
jgi:hypothetical protein